MQNENSEILGIDKSSGFALRVLILSLPAGIIFFILGISEILSPSMSALSYLSILFFNTAFLLPLSAEIQQVKKYINAIITSDDSPIELPNDLSEKEIRDLTDAVNAMHKFWTDKTDTLKNRTLTDAAVLDTLPDPLFMVNQQGVIIGSNLAARNLFSPSLNNNTYNQLVNNENFYTKLQLVLNRSSRSEDLNIVLAKNKFYTHINTLPWFAKGDTVAVITLYNIDKALRLEQMQQDFVANASHELRTPLSIISGFIETLLTSAKDDEKAREKFLHIMEEQVLYMSSLIENLLTLSKIDLSVNIPPQDKVSVNPLIREIKNIMTLKLKEKSLTLKTKLQRLPDIIADEHQINQILQNITDNAIKYATPDTEINITTAIETSIPTNQFYDVSEGKAISISISNIGYPLSLEDIARLTERFFRLQIHKNQNIKGTGLGLSIVSGIIKRHKGNMIITSEDNLTTFKIYLPVKI